MCKESCHLLPCRVVDRSQEDAFFGGGGGMVANLDRTSRGKVYRWKCWKVEVVKKFGGRFFLCLFSGIRPGLLTERENGSTFEVKSEEILRSIYMLL